jgi:hypothetical protein
MHHAGLPEGPRSPERLAELRPVRTAPQTAPQTAP